MHMTATVILGRDIDPTDESAVTQRIETLLSPFDENAEVPHRERMSRKDLAGFVEFYTGKDKGNPPVDPIPEGSPLSAFLDRVNDWDGTTNPTIVTDLDEQGEFETISSTSLGNPAGMWDWWVIGGRWRGAFVLKPGAKGMLGESGSGGNGATGNADVARICDIDLEATGKAYADKAAEAWEAARLDKSASNPQIMSFIYGIEPGDTKETYVARAAARSLATFSIVNGEWIARRTWNPRKQEPDRPYEGGFDDIPEDEWEANYERLLFKDLHPETVIAVIDYHS